MRKLILLPITVVFLFSFFTTNAQQANSETGDNPSARQKYTAELEKDPALGYVPYHRLLNAINYTTALKAANKNGNTSNLTAAPLNWIERGPIFDSVGPSNGNTRGGSNTAGGHTSGRMRAFLLDTLNDPTGNTAFLGGVAGGIWKCTNFLSVENNWAPVDDRFDNLAISSIAQDPTNPQIIYFATGEPTDNADRVTGLGVWKSTNGGTSFTWLASTANYMRCFKIGCDAAGNVYLACRITTVPVNQQGGLFRSTNGGTSWTNITPNDLNPLASNSCTDFEFTTSGNLNAMFGYRAAGNVVNHRYTNAPATVAAGTWLSSSGFRTSNAQAIRTEMAVMGNLLYAVTINPAYNTDSCYKSIDGGATWTKQNTVILPAGLGSGQGWYNISLAINPLNTSEIISGGLDGYRSVNDGATWTRFTFWVTTAPYVHADHHYAQYWISGGQTRIIMGTDGGVFYSNNNGSTFTSKNKNLGIKQFYSAAIHPTAGSPYLIAGAQDNGMHQLNNPGLSYSIEVTGGDGMICHINQQNPLIQFGSYVGNAYRRSINGGVSWSGVNFPNGLFVNPFDYDDAQNIMYCSEGLAGQLRRWDNANVSNTSIVITLSNVTGTLTSLKYSPHTANRLFFTTNAGRLYRLDNANTVSGTTGTAVEITGASFPSGTIICVNTGTDDNNLVATYSNYGVNNVWVSTNGGTGWTAIDGNLPDMPVRWAMFEPGSNAKLYLATEAGIYTTTNINGASTVWDPETTFPTVSTYMLKMRASDSTIVAGTHGRGLWTAKIPAIIATNPTVTINQAAAQPDPTSTSPINFTVVFDQAVIGFATGDVVLTGTAGATTGVVTGGPTTFNVAVSGMTSCGTVIVNIPAGVCTNAALEPNLASTSTDNTVTFFPAANPNVTINQAAAQPDPTSASPINFTVVFNQAVTGFATGDVTLSGTAGATTGTVSGSGTTYNVAVTGMTASGTVIATIAAGVAQNSCTQNNNASTSTDNTVTYNSSTPPTVTINQAAAQPDPTSASPINYTVVFSQVVTGFATGDVTLSGTAGATLGTVTGSGTTYNVAVSGMSLSGTVIATIPAGVCINGTGDPNLASTSTDNTVTYNLPPAACITTTSFTGPPVAIPDNDPVGVDIPITVTGVGTIADINFRLDPGAGTCDNTIGNTSASVDHTFNGDLIFTLTSPAATTVTLINRRGGSGNNFCLVTLDDDGSFPATSTMSTAGAITGNFAPENPLSAFDGQNANGTWILNVSDNAGVDIGSVRGFSLIITAVSPTMNAVPNDTVCAGSLHPAINFSSTMPGVTYAWTNNNPTIGLAASGTGNIAPFTATNAGVTPVTATITVTPQIGACSGVQRTFTITVNPAPLVNPVPNQVVCRGVATAPVNFTGSPASVIFQWTNNTPAIGLAAAGTGNIASFIAQNPGTTPLVATITVTPVTGLTTPVVTTFNFTGAVQTFVVPAGITSVNIKAWGAQGNSNALSVVGGLGGYAEGNLAVTPGQTLFINTGGGGATTINGGFNGGGAAGINAGCAQAQGGGGGGASDVRITANTLANRVLVAAGGGGAGANRVAGCGRGTGGGGGGGLYGGGGGAGWPGIPPGGPVPTGGTQSAGGAGGVTTFSPGPTNGFPGVLGIGGAGGTEIGSNQGGSATGESGGVGGGLIGAPGNYNPTNNWCGQSGAGGSSYIGGVTSGVTTPGLRAGNGQVQITYTPPSATTCFGTPRTFTITVNPNPNLVIIADPGTTICQGDPTLLTVVTGTSTPVGTLYTQGVTPVNGSPSQVFEPANAAFTSQAADDFTVPAGATWSVTQLSVAGIGAGAPTSVNVFFYANTAGNLPGAAIASYNNLLTFVRTGGNYVVTLPTALNLTGGTYWVSFQVNMSFATSGQWFWGNFGAANIGSEYAWQNPGGGFATPCTNWGYGGTGCNVGGGPANRNNIFTLTGTSVVGGGPLPGGYTFLWSPAAGLSSTTSNPVAASPFITTLYTVNVSTAAGCLNSASILITVNQRPTVTTHPVSRTNCGGTSATFTVAGTGTALTYQWQVSTAGCAGPWVNLVNGAPYSNVTTATLTVNPVTTLMSGYAYRCVLSGTCAPVNNANISNCAVLTVNPLPNVAITPTGPVCGGVACSFGTQLSVGSAPPPVPGSLTVNSGTINLPIPDNTANGVSNALAVAGVPANATITNISVALNMPHTYPHDMVFNLRAPNGQILSLYKHHTNTTVFPPASIPTAGWYNAVVNNTSTTAFGTVPTPFRYGQTAPAGPYRADALNGVTSPGYTIMDPAGFVSNATGFSALYTTPASTTGNWTLAMCDGGPADFGTLVSWSITIDYTTPGTGGGPVLTYVWSPLAGLYTDAAACIPYTGSNLATVYAAPTALTTYTVTATDVATGCINSASVVVNYTPPAPTVTPNPVAMCLGDPAVRLTSSSSTTTTSSFTSGTISVPIPEGAFPTGPYNAGVSTIAVSGIPAAATVASVKVRLNITHAFVGDVVAVLQAPNGQRINLDALLSATNNAGINFVNTDIGSTGVTALSAGTAPWTGLFKADAVGATFTIFGFTLPGGPIGYIPTTQTWGPLTPTGASANGNWTLALYDAGAPDIGTLTNWSIEIVHVLGVPATPAVWTPNGVGSGLFNDAAATIPYTGTPRDTVWARPTPAGVYPYQVTVQGLSVTGATIPLPPHVSTFTGNVRGYWFTAPSSFTMTSVEVPTSASTGVQSIAVLRFNGAVPPPAFPGTTNAFTTLFLTQNNPAAGAIPVNIQINAGDVIGILGQRATANSYSANPPNTTVINGTPVNLTRMGMQFPLTTTAPQQIWQEAAFQISRVFFTYGVPVPGCTSPARTVVVTVNVPTTVTTQPVNQTVCTDKVATFTVAAGGSGPFSYQWQVSTNSGNTWTNITNGGVYSGATTATLTITAPPVTMSGYFYRAIITGAAPCAPATSFQVILTVNPLPTVVISASPYTSLFPGSVTTLSSTVSPVAGSSFTWLRNGTAVPGAITGTLSVDVDGLGNYQLRVTDINGCTNISNIVTIKDSASGKCFLYPNPTSGKFQVRYHSAVNNSSLPRSLTVYDAKGDRVFTQMYTIGAPYDRMDVDMRAYGKGLYWVEIGDRNGNRLAMCRVVIQ